MFISRATVLALGLALSAAAHPPQPQAAKKPPAISVEADFKKALDLYNQQKYAEAMPLFKKVQKAKPARPDVYLFIGMIDAKTPNHELAITSFDRAIALNEKYKEAYFERAASRLALEQLDQAVADYSIVTQLDPDHLQAWYNRAQILGRLKNDQEAVNSYLQVLRIDPQHGYAHYYIGLSYYNLKQKDKSITHLSNFVKLMPTAPEAAWVKQLLSQIASW